MFSSDKVRPRSSGSVLVKMTQSPDHAGQPGVASNSSSTAGPVSMSWLAPRVAAIAGLVVVAAWVHMLGGVSLHRVVAVDGSVSTDGLFNWHPVLMLLAFGVFMTEAVLAYKAPWSAGFSRPQRKQVHLSMHSAAVVLALLGLLAAWKSHTLKVPPVPNLYSPHSWVGMAALVMMLAQYALGFGAYLWPTLTLEERQALGPYHRYWGLAVYGTGMAAAMLGLQEKATFLQLLGKKGVYSAFIRLPAVAELLVVATVLLVVYHYAPVGQSRRPSVQYSPVTADETAV